MQINSKYSEELAQECLEWIKVITSEPINTSGDMDNFFEVLKDGVLLCKLANCLQPGCIKKINESKMAFKCMENISGESIIYTQLRNKFEIKYHFSSLFGMCQELWCTHPRDIPECRSLGKTKPELGCYLHSIFGS